MVECKKDADNQCLQKKLFWWYELANIPMRYQRFDFEKEFMGQPDARETVEEYVDNIDNAILNGLGYYIHSSGLGTGKTAIATHIVKMAVKRIYERKEYECWFDSFFTLTDLIHLEEEQRRYLESRFLDSALLVIDDVTPAVSERQNAYYGDVLERVIRHRAHSSLSTIVTTNMKPEELSRDYGRIFSLLSDSCSTLELDSDVDTRIHRGVNILQRKALLGEVTPLT
jgi:DNA replication protein DnaC